MPTFSGIRSGASALAGRVRTGATSLGNRVLGRPTPGYGMPNPGIGMPNMIQMFGSFGNPLQKKNNTSVSFSKIFMLIVLSFFMGIFFMYINKKEKAFNFDSFDKISIVVALLVAGIGISYMFHIDMLNFIISSQINILCLYALVS